MLKNANVVITGATGQVGLPVALALAAEGLGNQVWAAARFTNPEVKARLEAAGVKCVVVDVASGEGFGDLPETVDHVLNFLVARTADSEADLVANAEAVGLLMTRFRDAKSFLHCSSTAVYAPAADGGELAEDALLGDNKHTKMMPNYVLTRVAAEAVARTYARTLDLPTVITRLNVPYGDNGGWPWYHLLMLAGGHPIPVPADGGAYRLIHEDDIVRLLPALLDAAGVPATTVNLAGSERVTIEEWVTYLGELIGKTPTFTVDPNAIEGTVADVRKLTSLVGEPTTVTWREGLERMVKVRNPELMG
ncbi:NAD-dependent epimerase/dehydratase family protein [Amycolatopsis sp. NPDC004368]